MIKINTKLLKIIKITLIVYPLYSGIFTGIYNNQLSQTLQAASSGVSPEEKDLSWFMTELLRPFTANYYGQWYENVEGIVWKYPHKMHLHGSRRYRFYNKGKYIIPLPGIHNVQLADILSWSGLKEKNLPTIAIDLFGQYHVVEKIRFQTAFDWPNELSSSLSKIAYLHGFLPYSCLNTYDERAGKFLFKRKTPVGSFNWLSSSYSCQEKKCIWEINLYKVPPIKKIQEYDLKGNSCIKLQSGELQDQEKIISRGLINFPI